MPIIMSMILNIAWEQRLITSVSGFAFSPMVMIANPRNRENTIICIISPLVSDSNGLAGIRFKIVSYMLGSSLTSTDASALPKIRPLPGWMMFASVSPMVADSAPVARNQMIVLTPMLRSFFISPSDRAASMMQKNTSGTTIILMRRINRSPTNWKNGMSQLLITGFSVPPMKFST